MGEMKRAQELRVGEFSVHKLRENHETIQRLTSQLQDMQGQMNSMNDSEKWNRITVGDCLTFPVNQQRFQVLVLCRAATNACHLTHGIYLDHRETLLAITFSAFDSSQNHHQGIHTCTTPIETGSVPQTKGTGTSCTRDEEQNRSTIPMPTFARRPSTMSSLFPVDIPQNSVVGQQRQQISELQFDKFPTPQSFLCWKIRFKNQVTTCSDFPSEAMLWIKEVELVDSLDEFKSPRSITGKNFPKFEMLQAKIASTLN